MRGDRKMKSSDNVEIKARSNVFTIENEFLDEQEHPQEEE